jgi:hypothetical protein
MSAERKRRQTIFAGGAPPTGCVVASGILPDVEGVHPAARKGDEVLAALEDLRRLGSA